MSKQKTVTDNSTIQDFGNRLDELMKKKKVSQAQLARDLGVNKNTVNSWVKGKLQPTLTMFYQILDYFSKYNPIQVLFPEVLYQNDFDFVRRETTKEFQKMKKSTEEEYIRKLNEKQLEYEELERDMDDLQNQYDQLKEDYKRVYDIFQKKNPYEKKDILERVGVKSIGQLFFEYKWLK